MIRAIYLAEKSMTAVRSERDWEQFWKTYIEPIPGWLNPWEGYSLYRLARGTSVGEIVEIGSYLGRSTLCLAAGIEQCHLEHGNVVHSVDLFESAYTFGSDRSLCANAETLAENLTRCAVRERVQIHHGDSRDRAFVDTIPSDIGFLFVDGDHELSSLQQEWTLWRPKLSRGATVAFHDYGNDVVGDGPTTFCDALRSEFDRVEVCDRFKREPDATPGGLFVGYGLKEREI